jgi:mandelate racemase
MAHPHRTASGTVTESPLVLTDVVTDGVVRHGMVLHLHGGGAQATADPIQNLAPAAIEQKLVSRLRLLGTQGLLGMALSGIDMALWGALARVHNVLLLSLLGGAERAVPAYGAVGYDGAVESAKLRRIGAPRIHRRQGEGRIRDRRGGSGCDPRAAQRGADRASRLWWITISP